MNVVVSVEQRFERTPDGRVWTPGTFPYSFWTRYLRVFDSVKVVARVRPVASATPGAKQADGDGTVFVDLPYYVGPVQYALQAFRVRAAARGAIGQDTAVILRVPSRIAADMVPALWSTDRPYGLEVVGDPRDVFAPGAMRHPGRAYFRWLFARELREECNRAAGIAYVTERTLQMRYPPAPGAFTTHYSSVDLPPEAFVPTPRVYGFVDRRCTLITVGSLDVLYKAPDVVIDAFAALIRGGLDLALVWVGDGRYRSEMEVRARRAGVGDRVRFLGQLPPGPAVRAQLDQADLFVLPSRQEGLPRAMIEAMARALPCIGSTVGGIPELLPPEDMVPPNDVSALAAKVEEVLANPHRMTNMSARNLGKAQEYSEALLNERRMEFYQYLKERTQVWARRNSHALYR